MSFYNKIPTKSQEENVMPLSLLFLKSIIAGLGIVLVVGFTFVIGMILLGGKYIAEKAENKPYSLAKNITLTPMVSGDIIDSKISPAGIEVLHKTNDGIFLKIYSPENGNQTSNVKIR